MDDLFVERWPQFLCCVVLGEGKNPKDLTTHVPQTLEAVITLELPLGQRGPTNVAESEPIARTSHLREQHEDRRNFQNSLILEGNVSSTLGVHCKAQLSCMSCMLTCL